MTEQTDAPQENPEEPTIAAVEDTESPAENAEADQEVINLQAQVADLEDRLKRAYAEQQNQRQRMLKEKAAHDRYAGAKLATDLLEVIDNLDRATKSVPISLADNQHVKNLLTGVQMVNEQFIQVFASHNILKINPMGERINYDLHETIAEADDNPAEANTVIDVLQAGYLMNDRLLRPAKVVISSGRTSDGSTGGKPVDEQV